MGEVRLRRLRFEHIVCANTGAYANGNDAKRRQAVCERNFQQRTVLGNLTWQ